MVRLGAAAQRFCERKGLEHGAVVIELRAPEFWRVNGPGNAKAAGGPEHLSGIHQDALSAAIGPHRDADLSVLRLNGNGHTVIGLF